MIFEKDIEKISVNENIRVGDVISIITSSPIKFCCVISGQGRLTGVVSYGDIVNAFSKSRLDEDSSAKDIMNTNFTCAIHGSDHAVLKPLVSRYRFVPLIDELKNLEGMVYGSGDNREYAIAGHKISSREDFILVAEIGNNHNGSLEQAYALIDAAKENGAHIAKFQMRDLGSLYGEERGSNDLSTEYVMNLLDKVTLKDDQMYKCFDYCHKIGITPLCTPFDIKSLYKLEAYGMEGYKIASADLTNHYLYNEIIETGKPIIASTGMSTDQEIDSAIGLLEKSNNNFALCHTNSTYPTPYSDIQLNYIKNLKERTTSVIGYSGHERGWHIPLAAFALGAQIIEKHFTLDKNQEGNDHKVSLLPEEFRQMADAMSDVAESLGDGHKRNITQGEANNRVSLAKSVFCAKTVRKGEQISGEHLEIRSPGNGLSPNYYDQLVGKTATRNIERNQPFYLSDINQSAESGIDKNPQHFKWSIPVRHRDVYTLHERFNPPSIEFHLSFKDMELNDAEILKNKLDCEVIVHAPEQFDEDFIIDLFSEDDAVAEKSIELLNRVFEKTRRITGLISDQESTKVIVNCGGHSAQGFRNKKEIKKAISLFYKRFGKLNLEKCRFLAQTMPPYPWHFGGQYFHNQFTSAGNISDILARADEKLELCLDISHSYMWCNHSGENFNDFVTAVLGKTAHIHISDASGTSSEGLQIGLGDVDFSVLRDLLFDNRDAATVLPEIWQGHEDNGSGFRIALNRLYEFGF